MKLETLTSGSSPSQKTRVSVKRWCSACIYYCNPYSNRQTWKNLFFSQGSMWSRHRHKMETLSVTRQCCLVHFWWKYFHHFSNSYFELYFLLNIGENFMLFQAKLTIMYDYIRSTSDKTYEKYWIFWWNHAKNIVQNMSWKNDENIFHQKCTKQHCLVTERVSIDACDEITLIPVKKITFFHVCRLL